jgi:hypothetical protein
MNNEPKKDMSTDTIFTSGRTGRKYLMRTFPGEKKQEVIRDVIDRQHRNVNCLRIEDTTYTNKDFTVFFNYYEGMISLGEFLRTNIRNVQAPTSAETIMNKIEFAKSVAKQMISYLAFLQSTTEKPDMTHHGNLSLNNIYILGNDGRIKILPKLSNTIISSTKFDIFSVGRILYEIVRKNYNEEPKERITYEEVLDNCKDVRLASLIYFCLTNKRDDGFTVLYSFIHEMADVAASVDQNASFFLLSERNDKVHWNTGVQWRNMNDAWSIYVPDKIISRENLIVRYLDLVENTPKTFLTNLKTNSMIRTADKSKDDDSRDTTMQLINHHSEYNFFFGSVFKECELRLKNYHNAKRENKKEYEELKQEYLKIYDEYISLQMLDLQEAFIALKYATKFFEYSSKPNFIRDLSINSKTINNTEFVRENAEVAR